MKREELVARISKKTKIRRPPIKEFIRAFLETIEEELQKGEEVSFRSFGRFWVSDVKGREMVRPVDGELMTIDDYKRINFSPSMAMKRRINGRDELE